MSEKTSKQLWFKAKNYGWGWYPSTWEGWVLTLGYIVIAISGATFAESRPDSAFTYIFFPFLLLLTVVLIFICYSRGEKPEWRWNGKPIFKKK